MNVPPIVALEVGTGMVRAVVGEVTDDGHLMITGFGEVPSCGVRKGEVIDFDPALECVRKALQMAEDSSNVVIHQVHLVVTGGHITSIINTGDAPVMNPRHEITEEEIEHVRTIARAVALPPDRQVLHTITQRFRVDDHGGVVDPEGLEGSKLSVDMLIVHGVLNRLRNVVKVVRSADVEVEDVAFAGLCSALAVLLPEEKEAGVAVLDIGAGTTDYTVYAENAIGMAGALPLGGDHITNDLACGLHISTGEAEKLKCAQGSAMADMTLRSRKIALVPQTGGSEQTVRLADVHTVIQARVEEILELVKKRVEDAKLLHHLGGGVVLTGGTACLPNVTKLAERIWRLPCRVGTPRGVGGLAMVTERPQYAATIGMIRYAYRASSKSEHGFGWIMKKLWRRA
jgi:cell division protein FtsA